MARREKDTTVWKQKDVDKKLRSTGSDMPKAKKGRGPESSKAGKAALLIGAGAIIAALAKGVKNSDYFDEDK